MTVRVEFAPGAWIDSRLAVWLEELRTLVVADLHWGYSASHRARGNLVPVWGDDVIEQRLRALIADYAPEEMIWLGDCLHAAEGRAGAERFLQETNVPVVVVRGNHDVRWRFDACVESVTRGPFFFHHGDASVEGPEDAIEAIGHLHPAVVWRDGAGTRLKLPALVTSARRWVLPAFSPWAAGAAWRASGGETLHAISAKRIFAVAPVSHGVDTSTR